jgi:osmotically-inducible protein OsmY
MKTDSQIQADVRQELKWDPSVTHEHIGVAVSDAVVTLSGTVPTYIETFAAEKAVQRVAGVKAVVEKIEVKLLGSYKRDDEDIAKAIVSQFKWSVQVPDELVNAKVENGWVSLKARRIAVEVRGSSVVLSGNVHSFLEMQDARGAAFSAPGVTSVENNLHIQ